MPRPMCFGALIQTASKVGAGGMLIAEWLDLDPAIVSANVTMLAVASSSPGIFWEWHWADVSGTDVGHSASFSLNTGATQTFTVNVDRPSTATRLQLWASTRTIPDTAGTFTATGTIEPICLDPAFYCVYGVENNPDAAIYETLTETIINTVVAAVLAGRAGPEVLPMVETALLAIEGTIGLGIHCTTTPNLDQEPLDLTNIGTWSPDRLQAWFMNAAWHFFCRCKAAPGGSPAPVPPPPPNVINPPANDGPAPMVCDASDICAFLTQIKSLLDQMNRQIAATRQDVIFIQRQHVPKGYQGGVLHTALTGTGSFTVSDILGLVVSLTTIPPGAGSDMDSTARTYYGVGHVNLGTVDGWLRRIVIGHSPQLVLDIDPDVTRVEYSFMPGTLASIQELLPLP